ncbi:MAG: hypothetical protein ABI882_15015, partial [Acidobacteriota bacterium]
DYDGEPETAPGWSLSLGDSILDWDRYSGTSGLPARESSCYPTGTVQVEPFTCRERGYQDG